MSNSEHWAELLEKPEAAWHGYSYKRGHLVFEISEVWVVIKMEGLLCLRKKDNWGPEFGIKEELVT